MPIAQETAGTKHEHVTVEFWGHAGFEGEFSRIGEFSTPSPIDRK